jgi:hypothetical protein
VVPESKDPDKDAKLNRIEHVTSHFLDRCFAFDQFGPLSIRPCHGAGWAKETKPDRLPATYHRTHGIRYFHGCYRLADDHLWGVNRRRKGGDHSLSALKSIRAAPTCWPNNAENAPASAANDTNAGSALNDERPDTHTRRTFIDTALAGLVSDLDQVAAGVVEHGRGHRAHVDGFLGEAHAEAAQSLVLGLDVVDGE